MPLTCRLARTLARTLAWTLALGAPLASAPAQAREPVVLEKPPQAPDPGAHYLFYLHGQIIEGMGRRPKHPQYGVYEYDQVLAALAKGGPVVISEARPEGARIEAYAKRVAAQVEALRSAGVPDDHIAVVGFSKGGWIAQRVSALLRAPIRYVLLAACPPGAGKDALHGQVLSIREQSDSIPSCRPLFTHAAEGAVTRELMIDLGGAHGAFYRPNPQWLRPLLEFVMGRTRKTPGGSSTDAR